MNDPTLGTPCKGVIDRLLTTPGHYGCDGEHGQGHIFRLVSHDETGRSVLVADYCDVHHLDS